VFSRRSRRRGRASPSSSFDRRLIFRPQGLFARASGARSEPSERRRRPHARRCSSDAHRAPLRLHRSVGPRPLSVHAGLRRARDGLEHRGGYSGYISLGHAASSVSGAYAMGVTSRHVDRQRHRPFLFLPVIGLARLASIPIGWVAYRTRAATFAIVTITMLFVAQQPRSTSARSRVAHRASPSRHPTSRFDHNVPFYSACRRACALDARKLVGAR